MVLGKRNAAGRAERYRPDVMHALLNLGDLYELAESRLCELSCVQARVSGGGLVAEALALRDLLLEGLDDVISQLPPNGKAGVWRTILVAVRDGKTITRLSRENVGRRRETVQRGPWPRAALLVAIRLLSMEKDVK